MLYWMLAAAVILLLALWEHGRTSQPFTWQIRFAVLVGINLTTAARCFLQESSFPKAVFLYFLINVLYILTVDDLQTQHMQTTQLYLLMLGGAVSALLHSEGWISRFLLFLLLFVLLHFLAKRPHSGIGSGDAKVIAALSLYFGFSQLFNVLFLSLAAGLIYGMGMILFKKATVKTALPFLPFLLVGTLLALWI